jgi:hypothetical protein
MANNPIGISFLPSDENQAMGPKRGQMEGDLGQAFKILSLRLPSVTGAHAIAPPALLNAPGAAGVGGGFNPQAAIFEALLRAMQGQGGGLSGPTSSTSIGLPTSPGAPKVIPGNEFSQQFTGGGEAPPSPVSIQDRRPWLVGRREE